MSRVVVRAGTVRIGKGGTASLSPDLFLGPRLILLRYDEKSKELWFSFGKHAGMRVYKSAPGSKSGTVGLMTVLKLFGLRKAIGGTYPAKAEDGKLVIGFGKRLPYNISKEKQNEAI